MTMHMADSSQNRKGGDKELHISTEPSSGSAAVYKSFNIAVKSPLAHTLSVRPSPSSLGTGASNSPLVSGSPHSSTIPSSAKRRPSSDLTEWPATAIAGNDILSSILYTIGLCTTTAGRWTPLALLIVSTGILYPFRRIYQELGEAIPQNGGSFNCMLQLGKNALAGAVTNPLMSSSNMESGQVKTSPSPSTSEISHPRRPSIPPSIGIGTISAAVAGTLSLLSYVSTAVVSAASATSYGALEFGLGDSTVFWLTFLVLAVFAGVTLTGLKESSQVATLIFISHCSILSLLAVGGLFHALVVNRGELWLSNFSAEDQTEHVGTGSVLGNVFFGVSTGLLGITGFETSSNYIQEQKPGVFPKTLRNMWILVTIFNPLLSVISLGVLPLDSFALHKDNLLSVVASEAIGPLFRKIVAFDAVLALSGGALTAYIGVNGLIMRMAEEGMLPAFLLSRNHRYGTYHNIIIGFLILTSTLYGMTGGSIVALSGVYTISFLGVLMIAALGCTIIRRQRRQVQIKNGQPATQPVFTWEIIVAVTGVLWGLLGQIIRYPENLLFFGWYFVGFIFLILLILYRRSSSHVSGNYY